MDSLQKGRATLTKQEPQPQAWVHLGLEALDPPPPYQSPH